MGATRIELEPMKVIARPHASASPEEPATPATPDGLEAYDAQMLFDRGLDLSEGEAWREAWSYFTRVEQEFPESALRLPALFNQAICALHLEDGESALRLLARYAAELPPGTDPLLVHRVDLKQGQALHLLGRYGEAAAIFDVLVVEDLPRPLHIEALVDAGIAHFMDGDRITAEYRFMAARRLAREANETERIQTRFFIAQASFYLAEILRLDFMEHPLTFPGPEELSQGTSLEAVLGPQLEEKCQRLLRAQAAFTRTVREGHSGWASAAGYKVGEMYEQLYDELVLLPAPSSLTEQQRAIYQELLAEKVLVLLEKAIRVWQSTVDMATRTGEENLWVDQARASLERVKGWVLHERAAPAAPGGALPQQAPALPTREPLPPLSEPGPVPAGTIPQEPAHDHATEETPHAPPAA